MSTKDSSVKNAAAPEAPAIPLPNAQRAADYHSTYTNNAIFEMSAFDVNITFGEIIGSEDNRLIVEQHVKVIMSPLHAKLLFRALGSTLQQYEATFGPIRPPELKTAEAGTKDQNENKQATIRRGSLPDADKGAAKDR